jgi:hypothetical protein
MSAVQAFSPKPAPSVQAMRREPGSDAARIAVIPSMQGKWPFCFTMTRYVKDFRLFSSLTAEHPRLSEMPGFLDQATLD